jgi:hypothetical protein
MLRKRIVPCASSYQKAITASEKRELISSRFCPHTQSLRPKPLSSRVSQTTEARTPSGLLLLGRDGESRNGGGDRY